MPDLHEIETAALLERAVAFALADPLGDGEECWKVVVELHRRGGTTVYEAATNLCRSEDAALRALGADVLGQLGFGEGYPFAELCAPTLVHLLEDTEPAVIGSALVALGHLGKGELGRICPLASHPSGEVRYDVAFCLSRRTEERAHDTLIRLSADDDPDVRDWATFGLGTLSEADTPVLRDALVARLNDADTDVRGEAMRGLARRSDAALEACRESKP